MRMGSGGESLRERTEGGASGVDGDERTEVRELVRQRMDCMTKGERKVARVLLARYPSAGLTTVAEVATMSGVSAPTVLRFASRIGFTGWPDVQRRLVAEINDQGSPVAQYRRKSGVGGEGVLERFLESFSHMLSTTFEQVPESEFSATVDLLSDPKRRVVVTGGRFSHYLAGYFADHLAMLRRGVTVLAHDENSWRSGILDMDDASVLVLFDFRRYSSDSARLAELAHGRGASVCLMTDHRLSPVSDVARTVLSSEVESASPFDSLTAATALTEALVGAVTERLGDAGKQRVVAFEELLGEG